MITGLLALVVAFFVTRGIGVAILRAGAKALGYGVAAAAHAGGERIKTRIAQAKAKASAPSVDDFGRVVFGSDAKYIDAVAKNTIDAVAEKLGTAEGKAEAAKRLAATKKGA